MEKDGEYSLGAMLLRWYDIDDPFLDLALFDVYRGGDLGVRQILADILESERRKREQPHFMLQLSLIKTCTVTHVQACQLIKRPEACRDNLVITVYLLEYEVPHVRLVYSTYGAQRF